MPTEHEYRHAAGEFRSLAATLEDQAIWAPQQPSLTFMSPGEIADVIDGHVREAISSTWRAAEELRRLAGICDVRAETCRAYRSEVRAYLALPPAAQQVTSYPVRPSQWVEL